MTTWIGTLAALLTTASFVPQALKVLRERKTEGISLGMYVLFCSGVFLWCIYGVLIGSPPVWLANGVTLVLAGLVLAVKIRLG